AQRPSDMPVTGDRPIMPVPDPTVTGGEQEPMPTATKAADKNEDAAIVAKLHHMNMMEVDVGKMARDKGEAKRVRDFGARLVRDHQAGDKKVIAYADKNGIDANAMPAAGTEQEAKDQEKMESLRNMTGREFDREFAMAMAEGHAKAVEMVQNARET